MKKEYIPTFLFGCSALLVIAFAVRLYFDYTIQYQYGSAPFWLYIVVRFVEFMFFAIGCFVAGFFVRKKLKENNGKE